MGWGHFYEGIHLLDLLLYIYFLLQKHREKWRDREGEFPVPSSLLRRPSPLGTPPRSPTWVAALQAPGPSLAVLLGHTPLRYALLWAADLCPGRGCSEPGALLFCEGYASALTSAGVRAGGQLGASQLIQDPLLLPESHWCTPWRDHSRCIHLGQGARLRGLGAAASTGRWTCVRVKAGRDSQERGQLCRA